MGGDHPSERRRDDAVGARGAPAAGGGGHTPQQAAVTDMGPDGRTDAERGKDWDAAGEPGRDPAHPGGASGGHAERTSPRTGGTVVTGQSKAERERAERGVEMSERETEPDGKPPANTAPDAVKDPNEKTEGKPGLGPQGEGGTGGEADPGGS